MKIGALLVTFGRLSDMYGRVKLYIYGFMVFMACSILLSVIPSGTRHIRNLKNSNV